MGNEQSAGGLRGQLPQGMQAMGSQLQKKFAKGVQYNMKVIIKGDRNTGKTCLLKRLQGGAFQESYMPTQEIQAASIHWNYRASDDVVKVEVWDIVDKGVAAQQKKSESLKLQNQDVAPEPDPSSPNLDACFVDVYKNTNGVIMMLDVCKAWTWKYVQREIELVPSHIPVIVLGNFRDMGEHRVVDREEVDYFLRSLDRSDEDGELRYAEVSMKNAFGLKYLHKFFNLPFLRLQRATLLAQLKTNGEDLSSTLEELNFHLDTEDQNYDVFVTSLEKRRKETAERLAQQQAAAEAAAAGTAAGGAGTPATAAAGSKPPPSGPARSAQGSQAPAPLRTPAASAAGASSRGQATATQPARSSSAAAATAVPSPTASAPTPSTASPGTTSPRPTSSTPTGPSLSQRFASKLGWRKESPQPTVAVDEAAAQIAAAREARQHGAKPATENIDEFVPEGGLGEDFLGAGGGAVAVGMADNEDDDESDDGRPVVAGFDDLDSDDDGANAYAADVTSPVEDVSDDDDDVAPPAITADADVDDEDDMPSASAVVAGDEDFDSEPSPPPVRKITKPKSRPQKPVVFEDVVTADDPSPPAEKKKPAKTSPRVKKAAEPAKETPPKKKKVMKKPAVVSSSEPSDSEDDSRPVVAPLEGDSGDEIVADTVPVVAEDEDIDPAMGPEISDSFMDHWLSGGTGPPPTAATAPVSAASLMMNAPLIPGAADPVPTEKKKKTKKSGELAAAGDGVERKKKKKSLATGELTEAGDGVEKKKKKKKKPQEDGDASGSTEVKKKTKKSSKVEKADNPYLL